MRRTGRYYYLGITFGLVNLGSTLMLISWHKGSAGALFWISQAPGGFGFAGMLTSTLIALIGSVGREEMWVLRTRRELTFLSAVATGSELSSVDRARLIACAVSYLFRTTGQVLGVSLSAAIVQAVLKRELAARITGNGASDVRVEFFHNDLRTHSIAGDCSYPPLHLIDRTPPTCAASSRYGRLPHCDPYRLHL